MSLTNWHSGARCYVGGRYCHQTPSLFTIITKQIHHRQTTKKEKVRQKRTINTWKHTEEKNQAFVKENKNDIHKITYIQKKQNNYRHTQ